MCICSKHKYICSTQRPLYCNVLCPRMIQTEYSLKKDIPRDQDTRLLQCIKPLLKIISLYTNYLYWINYVQEIQQETQEVTDYVFTITGIPLRTPLPRGGRWVMNM